jgi:hypothetical protein
VEERTLFFSFKGFENKFNEETVKGFGHLSRYFFASLLPAFSNRIITMSTKSSRDRSSCIIDFSVIPSVRAGVAARVTLAAAELDVVEDDVEDDVAEAEEVEEVIVEVEVVVERVDGWAIQGRFPPEYISITSMSLSSSSLSRMTTSLPFMGENLVEGTRDEEREVKKIVVQGP